MNDYDIEKICSTIDFEKDLLTTSKNGLLLTNYEISVLDKYKIDYSRATTLKEIIYYIEEILNEDSSLQDLENISQSIAERDYYMNTNK